MRARRAAIDFSHSPAIWTPCDPGFAQDQNAAALSFPYLEPYLIKVMKAARERLDPQRHAGLIAEINLFNQQEANHYQTHAKQNEVLRREYEGLEPFEASIRRDFDGFLRDRSLEFNLAYCEGFECLGPIAVEYYFERADETLQDADPATAELWRWHLAEEYEHRRVCHDAYRALYGGYLPRVRGLLYFLRHYVGHSNRVRRHMEAQDKVAGRIDTRSGAREQARRLYRRRMRFILPRLLRVLLPWYSPARIEVPAADRYLQHLDGGAAPGVPEPALG